MLAHLTTLLYEQMQVIAYTTAANNTPKQKKNVEDVSKQVILPAVHRPACSFTAGGGSALTMNPTMFFVLEVELDSAGDPAHTCHCMLHSDHNGHNGCSRQEVVATVRLYCNTFRQLTGR
jgi:hypothetical protein